MPWAGHACAAGTAPSPPGGGQGPSGAVLRGHDGPVSVVVRRGIDPASREVSTLAVATLGWLGVELPLPFTTLLLSAVLVVVRTLVVMPMVQPCNTTG